MHDANHPLVVWPESLHTIKAGMTWLAIELQGHRTLRFPITRETIAMMRRPIDEPGESGEDKCTLAEIAPGVLFYHNRDNGGCGFEWGYEHSSLPRADLKDIVDWLEYAARESTNPAWAAAGTRIGARPLCFQRHRGPELVIFPQHPENVCQQLLVHAGRHDLDSCHFDFDALDGVRYRIASGYCSTYHLSESAKPDDVLVGFGRTQLVAAARMLAAA